MKRIPLDIAIFVKSMLLKMKIKFNAEQSYTKVQ